MNHVNLLFYSADLLDESVLFEHAPFLAGKVTALITACFFTASLPAVLFRVSDGMLPALIIGGVFTLLSVMDYIMGTYPVWYGVLSALVCLPSASIGYKFSVKLNR